MSDEEAPIEPENTPTGLPDWIEDPRYLDRAFRYKATPFIKLQIEKPSLARKVERYWEGKKKGKKTSVYVDKALHAAAVIEFRKAGPGESQKVFKALTDKGFQITLGIVQRMWKEGFQNTTPTLPPISEVMAEDVALAAYDLEARQEEGARAARQHQVSSLKQQLDLHRVQQQGLMVLVNALFQGGEEGQALVPVTRQVLLSYAQDVQQKLPRMSLEDKHKAVRSLLGVLKEFDVRLAGLIDAGQRMLGKPQMVVKLLDGRTSEIEVTPVSVEEQEAELQILARQLVAMAGEEKKEGD